MRSLGDDEEEERSNNLTQPNPIISFETPTIRNILERTLFAVSRNHKIRSINDVEEEGENLNSDKAQIIRYQVFRSKNPDPGFRFESSLGCVLVSFSISAETF